MNWNELTSLRINGVEFVKLTRQSDGLVLFQKNLTPIPAQVNMTTYDYSTMIPSIIYVAQRDGSSTPYQFSCQIYNTTNEYVWYVGSVGSITGTYQILKSSAGKPYRLINKAQLGVQSIPYNPADGYGISSVDAEQQKQYLFTNPYTSEQNLQTQNITIRFGSITSSNSTLHLDGMNFKDDTGNVVLTIGQNYVGYSGAGFETDTTFNFNEHKKEQFQVLSIDETRMISFTIR